MTEDQAKQKWCPFVRHDEGWNRATWKDGDILNLNHNDGTHACNCIGSMCMAWRSGNILRGEGYCGLADRP